MSGRAIWGDEAGLRRAGRCPVVLITSTLAVGVSLLWWTGQSVEFVFAGPWRLVADVLPHLDVIHLAFNLWWLFVFGTQVESVLGSAKTLGLFVLLAAGSSAWQEGLADEGVGLSGLGYGLFGMLWVLSETDRRFRGLIDRQTVGVFAGWFVLCCVLTFLGVWRVGNVAHGSGAVLGALAGAALSRGVRRRVAFGIGAIAFLAGGLGVFVNPVPLVWMGASPISAARRAAWSAIQEGRNEDAARLYGDVIDLEPESAHGHFNRGIALERLERYEEALTHYRIAARLEPAYPDFAEAADRLEAWMRSPIK